MIDEVKVIGQISDVGLQITTQITDESLAINTTITEAGPQGPPGPPGSADVVDYNIMFNKPQIELVELVGNKTFEELGITSINTTDIDNLL